MWLAAYECQKLYVFVDQFYNSMQDRTIGNHQTYAGTGLLLRKLRLGEETIQYWNSFDHNNVGDYLKLLWPEAGFVDLLLKGQTPSRLAYKIKEELELARIKAEILRKRETYIEQADYEAIRNIFQKTISSVASKPVLGMVLPWLELANKKAELMLDYLSFVEKYRLGYEFSETFFTVRDMEFTTNSIELAEGFIDLKNLKYKGGYKGFKKRMAAENNSLKALETAVKEIEGLPAQTNMLHINPEVGGLLAVAVMTVEKSLQKDEEQSILKALRVEIAEKTLGFPGYRREGSDFLALDQPILQLLNFGLDIIYNTQLQRPEGVSGRDIMLQKIALVRKMLDGFKFD